MYSKVSLSSFHNGKIEYCMTSGSGDIEKNASVLFLLKTLFQVIHFYCMRQTAHIDNQALWTGKL